MLANNAFIIKEMEEEVKKEGREEVIKIGEEKAKLELARDLLDVLDDEIIVKKFGLNIEVVRKLREENNIELKK